MDRFLLFCELNGLEINATKKFKKNIILGLLTIDRVNEFDRLRIRLSSRNSWEPHILKSAATIKHRATATLRFARRAHSYPISSPLEMYKSQIRSAALYNAELWDCMNTKQLRVAENDFLRSLMNLGRNTPLVPLKLDLDLKPIKYIAA